MGAFGGYLVGLLMGSALAYAIRYSMRRKKEEDICACCLFPLGEDGPFALIEDIPYCSKSCIKDDFFRENEGVVFLEPLEVDDVEPSPTVH